MLTLNKLLRLIMILPVMLWLLLAAPNSLAQQPTLDEINAVARELYCPLCNGVRLDTCELQACEQMRQVIADKLAAGYSKEQIKEEFVAQYGPVVLGEPPRQGLNLLAWILPAAALIIGAGWLFYTTRRWTRQTVPAPPLASAAEDKPGPAMAAAEPADPYLARVETELADID